MKYGFIVTTGDPRTVSELASEAEEAGWDGVFYWDAVASGDMEIYDPWVVMAAMAMRTDRVQLGAIVTPPSRRRPWKLAREAMTLDRLSNGRLVMPVGLGALDDRAFGGVGEATEARVRAQMLDESLAILEGLVRAHPHQGLPVGREDAWGIDAMSAVYSVGSDEWRRANRAWFDRSQNQKYL